MPPRLGFGPGIAVIFTANVRPVRNLSFAALGDHPSQAVRARPSGMLRWRDPLVIGESVEHRVTKVARRSHVVQEGEPTRSSGLGF